MGADLHLHSTYSDGSFSPRQLVEMALKKGISTIAVSDHDTVEGIEKAIAAAKGKDLEVIPAIEFSTFRGEAEIHILGYNIDYKNQKLLNITDKIFKTRLERANKMVKKLNKLGIDISQKQVRELAGDDYVGRPHIARAMIASGYISEMKDAFTDDYIGNAGRAYVSKYKISPEKAINLIKQAGGIPVLAHPVFINHGQPMTGEGIKDLKEKGLQGVEVYHTKHDQETTAYYKKIASQLDLLITGGTDFHGENSPDIEMGDILLADKYVAKLKKSNNYTQKRGF